MHVFNIDCMAADVMICSRVHLTFTASFSMGAPTANQYMSTVLMHCLISWSSMLGLFFSCLKTVCGLIKCVDQFKHAQFCSHSFVISIFRASTIDFVTFCSTSRCTTSSFGVLLDVKAFSRIIKISKVWIHKTLWTSIVILVVAKVLRVTNGIFSIKK